MMLGLVKPTDGAVRILGKTMNEKNRLTVLSMIGSLIESPAYYGHLSGRENLEIAATLKGVNKKSVSHALEIVHLNDVGNKKCKTLLARHEAASRHRLCLTRKSETDPA